MICRSYHAPVNRHEIPRLVTRYISCSDNSGGSGGSGSDCDPNGGGTGGTVFDEISDDTGCVSPILIDLGDDGFAFGGPENPVVFDLLGLGVPFALQWVQPNTNDAFLVHDLDGDGLVFDGSELFGNDTRMVLRLKELALNGYQGLSQWDQAALGGNEDGYISPEDLVWDQLLLWVDRNAEGISQPSEMRSLGRIQRLESIPSKNPVYDVHGNLLLFWSEAETPVGNHQMVDVFFNLL